MVRKTLAYLLLVLIVFNATGYYGVFLGWQFKNNLDMLDRLEAERYTAEETITLKIPITIPYATDTEDFRRVDGMFEYRGEYFRLVKQKFVRDTLVVVCIKDQANKRLRQAFTGYLKTFTAKAAGQLIPAKPALDFSKDYIVGAWHMLASAHGWTRTLVHAHFSNVFIPSYVASIIHPPERA